MFTSKKLGAWSVKDAEYYDDVFELLESSSGAFFGFSGHLNPPATISRPFARFSKRLKFCSGVYAAKRSAMTSFKGRSA